MSEQVKLSPYEKLLAKARGQASPLNAQYEITYRCNHRCDFCYNAPLKQKELDTEQAREVIDKVADFGVLFLTLTGGEPLVRRDFFELGRYAVSRGLGSGSPGCIRSKSKSVCTATTRNRMMR
jgi:MoaA/NifB/PqqE/SkfB family radical SAM enzyme